MNYWQECIECAFEEAGIMATAEQIESVADTVRSSHENYGMAYPTPQSPLIGEVAALKRQLRNERSKVHCQDCNGAGSITTPGPYHSSTSRCWKCKGEGRVDP